jgi:RHH-type proline utilization regulon transcriptional repressor/proline dehydrogenase/delta 1-pyrroline-5-carboxylate dehydrogenase
MSYLACARKLLDHATDRIYPQFATHNAHTVAAILEMAEDRRLRVPAPARHGRGAARHGARGAMTGHRLPHLCPGGRHRDLLAYLVRRLLENGANSSFVNQMSTRMSRREVARDPFERGAGRRIPHVADPGPVRAGARELQGLRPA